MPDARPAFDMQYYGYHFRPGAELEPIPHNYRFDDITTVVGDPDPDTGNTVVTVTYIDYPYVDGVQVPTPHSFDLNYPEYQGIFVDHTFGEIYKIRADGTLEVVNPPGPAAEDAIWTGHNISYVQEIQEDNPPINTVDGPNGLQGEYSHGTRIYQDTLVTIPAVEAEAVEVEAVEVEAPAVEAPAVDDEVPKGLDPNLVLGLGIGGGVLVIAAGVGVCCYRSRKTSGQSALKLKLGTDSQKKDARKGSDFKGNLDGALKIPEPKLADEKPLTAGEDPVREENEPKTRGKEAEFLDTVTEGEESEDDHSEGEEETVLSSEPSTSSSSPSDPEALSDGGPDSQNKTAAVTGDSIQKPKEVEEVSDVKVQEKPTASETAKKEGKNEELTDKKTKSKKKKEPEAGTKSKSKKSEGKSKSNLPESAHEKKSVKSANSTPENSDSDSSTPPEEEFQSKSGPESVTKSNIDSDIFTNSNTTNGNSYNSLNLNNTTSTPEFDKETSVQAKEQDSKANGGAGCSPSGASFLQLQVQQGSIINLITSKPLPGPTATLNGNLGLLRREVDTGKGVSQRSSSVSTNNKLTNTKSISDSDSEGVNIMMLNLGAILGLVLVWWWLKSKMGSKAGKGVGKEAKIGESDLKRRREVRITFTME